MSHHDCLTATKRLFSERLFSNLARVFKAGDYADLVIRCGSETWRVHKVIVCGASKFFRTACDGKFLEAHSSKIVLHDEESEVIEAMLLYLYTGNYEAPKVHIADNPDGHISHTANSSASASGDLKPSAPQNLVTHVKLYIAADKYDIDSLKTLVLEKMRVALTEQWSDDNIFEVVRLTYANTRDDDQGLRKLLTSAISGHIQDLVTKPACKSELGTFGVDLLQHVLGNGASGSLAVRQLCGSCQIKSDLLSRNCSISLCCNSRAMAAAKPPTPFSKEWQQALNRVRELQRR